MAQRTVSAFKSTKNSRFADNTTGLISEADSRDMYEDVADSFLNISDHLLDEDDMASNSATKVPSQQSVKAYVDAQAIDFGYQTVVVDVSSAEILSLNSSPKEVIPAPGAGMFINIIKGFIYYDFVSAAYANPAMVLEYGSGQQHNSMATVLSQTVDYITVIGAVSINAASADLVNQNMRLRATAANPTTGSGTLKVKLLYKIESLS